MLVSELARSEGDEGDRADVSIWTGACDKSSFSCRWATYRTVRQKSENRRLALLRARLLRFQPKETLPPPPVGRFSSSVVSRQGVSSGFPVIACNSSSSLSTRCGPSGIFLLGLLPAASSLWSF